MTHRGTVLTNPSGPSPPPAIRRGRWRWQNARRDDGRCGAVGFAAAERIGLCADLVGCFLYVRDGRSGNVADASSIEWTQATWNPTTGCDKVSAGCDNCYALTLAKRLKAMGAEKYQNDGDPRTSGPGFGITVHSDALDLPYTWRTPRLVFVNSMNDLSVGVWTGDL